MSIYKTCPICNESKSSDNFWKRKNGNCQSYCKICTYENRPIEYKQERVDAHILKAYGLTPEQWQLMFNQQNGNCKICGVNSSQVDRRFAVDHCHKTGKNRGLLCGTCNRALGLFKDDSKLLLKASKYLEEHT